MKWDRNAKFFKLINFLHYHFPLISPFIKKVANHFYDAEVLSEYIIKGNAAIIKCNIPSFVTDFVKVESWIGTEGGEEYKYDATDNNSKELKSLLIELLDEAGLLLERFKFCGFFRVNGQVFKFF